MQSTRAEVGRHQETHIRGCWERNTEDRILEFYYLDNNTHLDKQLDTAEQSAPGVTRDSGSGPWIRSHTPQGSDRRTTVILGVRLQRATTI
jgi:hypothetical protein